MPRARNIKPALFKNEFLGTADPILTVLFTGLWCLADKAGRLEDRPLRIKAEIFPYRNLPDFNGYLTELERMGFIRRYSVSGLDLIDIPNFAKHQNPHHTEKPSQLPEFIEGSCLTVKEPLQDVEPTDALLLIPDSGLLIPETTTSSTRVDPCPVSEVIKLFHVNAPSLVQPRIVTDAVKAQISARWRESPVHQSLDFWGKFFDYCEQSDFLAGRADGRGGKPFRAGLEWIVKSSNFAKIINGNYENSGVPA